MIRIYKKTIILTSFIILIPIFAGLLLWNRLPEQMPVHFSFDGTVDGWGSKPFVVVGLPFVMLALHWFCIACTSIDPKQKNIGRKMIYVVLWIVPVISLFADLICYANALGYGVDVSSAVFFVIGIMFIIVGNYMPKSGQSYTVGYKIPWTLNSEENWNRTHRLAGWLWILGGFLFIVGAVVKWHWIIWAVLPIAVIPVIYSAILYKKGI
ncbi:MAG: SdpI family protein [Eubacteriales bacterium]|nr:SdpI family protein [Eubacteriales bacterium]